MFNIHCNSLNASDCEGCKGVPKNSNCSHLADHVSKHPKFHNWKDLAQLNQREVGAMLCQKLDKLVVALALWK